jgi:hypothetical protein
MMSLFKLKNEARRSYKSSVQQFEPVLDPPLYILQDNTLPLKTMFFKDLSDNILDIRPVIPRRKVIQIIKV